MSKASVSVSSINIRWVKASHISKSNMNGGRGECTPTGGEITSISQTVEGYVC